MRYILYETTNIINGKFYIGVHKINGSNYLGSGNLLKLAIKKYGRDNFMRETLKEFDNEFNAYEYEKLIIEDKLIKNKNCYNICKGGNKPPSWKGKRFSNIHCKNLSLAQIGRKHSRESKENNSKSHKGKKHNKKTIKTLRKINIGRLNSNAKRCIIEGKIFETQKDASNYFNIDNSLIGKWIKNPNKPNCYREIK